MTQEHTVILLGDTNVGKTALLTRCLTKQFVDKLANTQGMDFVNVTLDTVGSFRMWDTAGKKEHRTFSTFSGFKNISAILICFDLTEKKSFDNIDDYFKNILPLDLQPVIFLVGLKSDAENQAISEEEIAKKASEMHTALWNRIIAKARNANRELFEKKEQFQVYWSLVTSKKENDKSPENLLEKLHSVIQENLISTTANNPHASTNEVPPKQSPRLPHSASNIRLDDEIILSCQNAGFALRKEVTNTKKIQNMLMLIEKMGEIYKVIDYLLKKEVLNEDEINNIRESHKKLLAGVHALEKMNLSGSQEKIRIFLLLVAALGTIILSTPLILFIPALVAIAIGCLSAVAVGFITYYCLTAYYYKSDRQQFRRQENDFSVRHKIGIFAVKTYDFLKQTESELPKVKKMKIN